MTKISPADRNRPRHEPAAASHPADPARAASVARGTTSGTSGLPSPLANRRPPTTAGALAPRAALPLVRAAGTPSLRELPRSTPHRAVATDRPSSGVQLEHLPPVPRIRDPRYGWRQLWRKVPTRRAMFDPLRLQYQRYLGRDVAGVKFLQRVNELTGAPGTQAFTTPRTDTTQFIVRIPGVDEPVRLLRRDAEDGTLGDLVRLTTGSDEEIAKELQGIERRWRQSVGRRNRMAVQEEAAEAAAGALAAEASGAGASLPGVPSNFFNNKVQSKARMRICEPVLQRYVASTGKPTTMASFLEMVFRRTALVKKRPTERPDISHFLVQMPGTGEPLNVLRRDTPDGMLADINIAQPGEPGSVAREIAAMFKNARTFAGRGRVNEEFGDAVRPRNPLPKELNDVYEAFRAQPENLNLADVTFHTNLCEWAEKAIGTARKTRYEGLERFIVDVPHYGPVELLGQRDEQGRVVSVQRQPSGAELEHMLQRMGQLAKISRSTATAYQTGQVKHRRNEEGKRRLNMWKTVKSPLQGEFQIWKEQHVGKMSGAGSFVAHLEDLCEHSAGEPVVVDDEKSVTRHRIRPNTGSPPFTVLRYTDAAGLATGMRVIDATLTEQQAIAAMSNFEQRSKRSRVARGPAGPQRVLAEELDQPAAKQVTNAKEMRRALEGMLANKRAGEKNLLAGLDNEDELRTWFQVDGSLMPSRTAGSFANLRGFRRARESMASLLTQLGQQSVVNSLPPPMTAELMGKVLKARADHPEASTDELMQLIGLSSYVYNEYLSLTTGALHSTTRLRLLPDYEAHWTEIRDALSRLGHAEQAAQVRGPVSNSAEAFIDGIEDEMYALQRALHVMRGQVMPRLAAARHAGLSNPGLLRALADKQGRVRNLQFIASRLPGEISPNMAGRLGAAVRRLSELAERDMTVRLLKGRVRKLFVVGITAARTGGGAGARSLRDLYADNPDLIRKPRSFANERPRQTLRWLSTALRNWSPDGVEIQTYYDPDKGEIWVSSNVDAVNEQLRAFLSSGGLMDKLAAVDEDSGHARRMDRDRTNRQMSKLKRTLDDPSLQPNDEAKAVLKAMAARRFRVPPPHNHPKGNGPGVNQHAERRIRDTFLAETGHPPDPSQLTGTRRPCGVCAKNLDLPPSARRGPIWLSRASRAGHDPQALAEEYAKAAIPTFISQKRDGHWTADHNTDSESDLEVPAAKRRAVAHAPDDTTEVKLRVASAPPMRTGQTEQPAVRSGQPIPAALPPEELTAVEMAAPPPSDEQAVALAEIQELLPDIAYLIGPAIEPSQLQTMTPAELHTALERHALDSFIAYAEQGGGAPPDLSLASYVLTRIQDVRMVLEPRGAGVEELSDLHGELTAQYRVEGRLSEHDLTARFVQGSASGGSNECLFDTLYQHAERAGHAAQLRRFTGVAERGADRTPFAARMQELFAQTGLLARTDYGYDQFEIEGGSLEANLLARITGLRLIFLNETEDGDVQLDPAVNGTGPDAFIRRTRTREADGHFVPLWPRGKY